MKFNFIKVLVELTGLVNNRVGPDFPRPLETNAFKFPVFPGIVESRRLMPLNHGPVGTSFQRSAVSFWMGAVSMR